MKRRRRWWHCTQDDHGQTFRMESRPPIVRGDKEPIVPRICVAPSVPCCFAAVLFNQPGPVYCYRTREERPAIPAVNVWDSVVTRERWIVSPAVEFELDRVILPAAVSECVEAIRIYHSETRAASTLRLKVCQYAIAVEVLGGDFVDKKFAAAFLETINVRDPEEEILRCAALKLERRKDLESMF